MISWRHKIHRNPEAAYTEFNTATLVTDALRIFGFVMVPGAGLEPAQCCHRRILSPLRLPISPPGHTEGGVFFNHFLRLN